MIKLSQQVSLREFGNETEKSQDVHPGWKLRRNTKRKAQRGGESGLQRNIKGRVGWGEENQTKSGQSTHGSLWEKP